MDRTIVRMENGGESTVAIHAFYILQMPKVSLYKTTNARHP